MKKNLAASYAAQIYVALLNILVVPVLMKLVGTEAYGLIGFFAMVQGWLLLMDAGMSPSLGRAASQYKSGGSSAAELKSLVRFSSRIFFLLAIGFLIVSIPAAPWIASNWLSVKNLSIGSVEFSIVVMLFAVAIRWRSQPYRSIITGLEEQVWLNAFNAVLVTFRTFGSVAVALICGPNLFIFFLINWLSLPSRPLVCIER